MYIYLYVRMYICMDGYLDVCIYIYTLYIHSKLYGCSAVPGPGMKTREGIGDGWHE